MVKSKISPRSRMFVVVAEMAALGAALVIFLVFLASTLDGYLIRNGQGAAVISAMLADLTNTDRGVNHIGELTVSPTLTAIAQLKANDMAQKGYFAHTSPEGRDPWYWFKEGGYIFTFAGENLAVNFSDSADVERAWMNSPTHRANILNGHFTQIGIATAVGTYEGQQTTFVVQEFGTPAHTAAAQVQEVTNTPKATEIAIATTLPKKKPAPTPVVVPIAKKTATTSTTTSVAGTATPSSVLGTSAEGLTAQATVQKPQLETIRNIFTASPRTTLRYAYYLFGLLILIALIIETGIEFKRHHLRHVGLVVALLVLMSSLFLIADSFVFTEPVIAQGGVSNLAL